MDNLKTLFDKKHYDLIIKITRNSSNADDIIYAISSFVALGKLDDALLLINEKKEILKKDLPILMKAHIDILCLKGDFDKAYEEAKK